MDKKELDLNETQLFNSPLEVALRLLFIFKNTTKSLDQQRLVYYNYLVTHSSDIENAPKSLHADLPRRSCEILVNSEVIKQGLTLLISKDLITVNYLKNGIYYKKNKKTDEFLSLFSSNYAKQLDQISKWVSENFDKLNSNKMKEFIESNLGKWGSEFSTNTTYGADIYE